ncbi:hypothetical protein AgCh_026350 [Apium graveolens]
MSDARAGKIHIISELWEALDDHFKQHLEENANNLFRLLKIKGADLLAELEILSQYVQLVENVDNVDSFIDRENELRQSKPATPQPPQRAPLDPWTRSRLSKQFAPPKEEKSSDFDI